MKPEAMNIIKMISKPVNERMPFEGVQLTKFIQKLTFFKRYFPYQSQKFISFCLTSSLMQFKPGQDLFSKQTKPNLIYIIVDGLVQVQSKTSKIIRVVDAYDVIGQVQIVFGLEQRGQTARILNQTYCMAMKAQSFREVWQKQDQVEKAYQYLCSNNYFQSIPQYQKKHLALLMIKNYFKPKQIIAFANTLTQKVYFIVYGEVNVIKKLKVKQKQKQVILQNLQQMDSFGQYESINKLISEVTLQAVSSGSYYTIYIAQAIKIKSPFIELIKQNGLPYPDHEELQFRFQVQSQVEKYQDKVKKKLYLYQ